MDWHQNKDVCGIVVKNSIDYLQKTFAELAKGSIVVPLRDSEDTHRIEAAGVEKVIDTSEGGGWIDVGAYSKTYDAEPALVQFSSGTEGTPKAIVLTHANLANTTDRLKSVMEMDDTVREYVGVPVYYSFGFGRCRAVTDAGGKAFIPEGGFDPSQIVEMLEADEINAVSAVPSLWRIVLQNADLFSACGPKVKWIEIGSQSMSADEKAQLKRLFPNAKIVQHYGLTEASRTTFLKIHDAEQTMLESVGRAYGDIVVELDPDGRIKTRGPHVGLSVIADGVATSLADDQGWLTTNDVGHIDEGYLFFDGRADDLINCNGIKLSPEETEQAILAKIGLKTGLHVAKVADPMRGDAVLIAMIPELDNDVVRNIVADVLSKTGIPAGGAVHYMPTTEFPTTETGKIQRKALTAMFEGQDSTNGADQDDQSDQQPLSDDPDADEPPSMHSDSLDDRKQAMVAIWEESLGISPISTEDSFFDLGGDSLSAIGVALKLEKLGISRKVSREIFEGKSITELLDSSENPTGRTPLANGFLTVNAVRGVLVLCVIASHWMPGVIARLPAGAEFYNQFLAMVYSAGTPGFALIFGIGLGFAYLPLYHRSPEAVVRLSLRNAALLFGGVLAIGSTRIAAALAEGQAMSPLDISNSFYGVLTYYAIAVLSVPLWLKYLSRLNNLWLPCMALAIACYAFHAFIQANNPAMNPAVEGGILAASENPLIQTLILLLTGGYGYFGMTAGVMVGLAFGCWVRQLIIDGAPLGIVWKSGLLLIALSVVMAHEVGQLELFLVWPKLVVMWTWVFYVGVVLFGTWLVYAACQGEDDAAWFELLKALSIIGILAFPLFIGHEIVIPFKDLLAAFNVPGALLISLAAFFVVTGYMFMRLRGMYYPAEEITDGRDIGV